MNIPLSNFSHVKFMHMELLKEREDDREMYYRNLSRNLAHSMQSEMEQHPRLSDEASRDVPRRKASINELTEDEIVFAYNKLRMERNPIPFDAGARSEDLSSELQKEFLKWMEMKRSDDATSKLEKYFKAEKVNIVEESEIPSEVVNVVKDEVDTLDDKTITDEVAPDFEDFKDVISDNEDEVSEEYLKVSLMIREDGEDAKHHESDPSRDESLLIPTVIESNIASNEDKTDATDSQPNTVEAKMTLSNAPLEVITSLSSSSVSLASDKSCDEGGNKRPAKHSKGRAPLPPMNVIPGHFYDHVTKKHFKETEL